jgi:allantoicase
MSRLITEMDAQASDSGKMVEIKHTRTMQDAAGNDVEIVDFTESRTLDDAIQDAENRKANYEEQLTLVNAELADLQEIKDAE